MPYCLYCGKTKDSSSFTSREHVIPKTLDGNFDGKNPFIISTVCDTCNHTAGQHIDLPFAKSWFQSFSKADSYLKYYPITPTARIPLRYFGELSDIEHEGFVCEFWFGPAGDPIYHFHTPHPPSLASLALSSMKAHRKKIDPGFVFVFLNSNNPQWQRVTINSVLAHFKKSVIHAPQFKNAGENPWLTPVPNERLRLLEALWAMDGQQHTVHTAFHLLAERRFMCKLALGVGDLFLKSTFAQSEQASLLRKGMWARVIPQWESIDIPGIRHLGPRKKDTELKEMLGWPYGHTVGLIALPNSGILMFANFYGIHDYIISLAPDQEHWNPQLRNGTFYLMVPCKKTCIGPFRYEDYLFHNTGVRRIPAIEKVEKDLDAVIQPPKMIDSNNSI